MELVQPLGIRVNLLFWLFTAGAVSDSICGVAVWYAAVYGSWNTSTR